MQPGKYKHLPRKTFFPSFLGHSSSSQLTMASVDAILATKYPAKAHARRVAESLQARHGEAGVLYLEAQKTRFIEDNDETMPFR